MPRDRAAHPIGVAFSADATAALRYILYMYSYACTQYGPLLVAAAAAAVRPRRRTCRRMLPRCRDAPMVLPAFLIRPPRKFTSRSY